jgi:glycosyltransferase involved in cell wall biosynthesis
MLATGLADRGIGVSVAGPSTADMRFSFSAAPDVSFTSVEIGDRPRPGDVAGILRLRRLLLHLTRRASRDASLGGHVVHAHGLRAGALTLLALTVARERRPGVVVTVHNASPGGGVAGLVYRLLECLVARGADLVLCVSPDLERRMRAAGAHRVERAVIAAPDAPPGPAGVRAAAASPPVAPAPAPSVSGALASGAPPAFPPAGRPVVLAAGRLAAQKGLGVLLEAAAAWRDLDPLPLVVIAGDGPLMKELRVRAAALGVAAVFLGHRDDVPARLAAAAVFVLPSLWEGQPLVLQEALRAGTPVVATRVGGVPGLTGEDAALLVPPGDAWALAAAVRSVLTDAPLAARLRAAAARRAATLPAEADAVTAALDAYASARRGTRLR